MGRTLAIAVVIVLAAGCEGPPTVETVTWAGRVVMLGEEPVTGALVKALDGERAEVASAWSDLDGRFRMRVPASAERLFAVDPDVGQIDMPFVDSGQDLRSIRLDLIPARTVRGRVTDLEGSPVTGATVCDLPLKATTGRDGRFEMLGVICFATGLEVRHPGFAPGRVRVPEGGQVEVTIALSPAGHEDEATPADRLVEAESTHRVRGRLFTVEADGVRRYLGGITVSGGYSEGLSTVVTTTVSTAVTDPDGRFELSGLSEYDRDIFLEDESWYLIDRTEIGRDGTTEIVELRAARTRDIEGTVIGPDGKPVSGVRVRGGRAGSVYTDALGRFRLRHVAGAKRITAAYELMMHGGTAEPGMVIRLERLQAITGRLTDADGEGVGCADIRARGVDGRHARSGSSFPDGRFRLPEMWGGEYTLEVSAKGFETRFLEAIEAGREMGEIQLKRLR